jgi:hypothetical protein
VKAIVVWHSKPGKQLEAERANVCSNCRMRITSALVQIMGTKKTKWVGTIRVISTSALVKIMGTKRTKYVQVKKVMSTLDLV